MPVKKKVESEPEKDKRPRGFGENLIIVSPDGRVFSINEDDIQQYKVDENSIEYGLIKKDFIDTSSILARTPEGVLDSCICVLLNLKTLGVNRSPNRK